MDREQVLIGADVGATTIAAALVTPAGEVVAFEHVPTHGRGQGTAVQALLDLVDALLRRAAREGRVVSGIGIGLPGIVDAGTGMVISGVNLPELVGVALVRDLRAATGLPVFADNDVNALALAESTFGIGGGAASMAVLAVGTGVGGAIVLGGEILRGHSGCAGEFGLVSIDFQGSPRRLDGGRGILDDYVSGEALARSAREVVERGESSTVLALAGGDPERITAALVFEAAAAGDGPAMAIVERACEALGAGIAAIVNILNPELVVVTGGVARSFAPLENRVGDATRRYALPQALAGTRVRFVSADKRRTVLGGAALALSRLGTADVANRSGVLTGDEPSTTGRR